MSKTVQWIIIWLLALIALNWFTIIKKIDKVAEDTRIGIITENLYNTRNIISELEDIETKQAEIGDDVRELKDVLLDDFPYYMKKIVNE